MLEERGTITEFRRTKESERCVSLPVLLIVIGVLMLAGCGKKPTTVPDGAGIHGGRRRRNRRRRGRRPGRRGARPAGRVRQPRAAVRQGVANIIYFDFDRSDIRPEYASLISSHAKYLAGSSAVKIRLEGHTDERGSREYNIALAERRAQAVRRALMLQGAGDAQLTTVSYGEERPATAGSDESAYEKNRRVELVYGR